MSRWTAASLALLLACSAWAQDGGEAPEREFRLFGTSNTYVELNERPTSSAGGDDQYWKVHQILTLNLAWSRFTIGMQGAYLYYSEEELVDPLDLDRLRDTWELRKYFVEYAADSVQARLGTFYASFGRGLTLYVQKDDALGIDEPVHGATATASLGRFDLTVLGGRVTEPLLENQYGREFEDQVWGGRALARLPGDLYVGASYVGATLDVFFSNTDSEDVEVWAVEGGGSGILGLFDVHGEWADLERVAGTRVRDGHGRYLSLSSTFGALTLLGEYKDYLNFEYRYNSPPTAGRNIEAYDHNDAKGARLMVEGEIAATGTMFYASYGDFNTHREPTSPGGSAGDAQTEWYAGVEQYSGPVYLEASYFGRDLADRGIEEEHIIADFHLSLARRHELIAAYDKRLEKSSYFRTATHRSSLGWSWAPWGTLSVRHAWEESSFTGSERFWGGEVEVNPRPSITCGVFFGGDPGGLACSGGQCREEPRFKGYKAHLTWRF